MPRYISGGGVALGDANTWTALQTFAAGALLGSNDTLAWGDAVGGGTADTILQRVSANILGMYNAANSQEFQVYGFRTDASNYERFTIRHNPAAGGIWELFSEEAGTGNIFGIRFGTGGTDPLDFVTAGAIRWTIDGTTGALLSNVFNTYDIGSTTKAFASLYAGTSVNLVGANAQNMALRRLTELTTIAAAATTDTTIQIPANSLVLGVTLRVTTVIPTAATFDIGVAGATTRYGTGISTAATTTNASPGTTNPTIYATAASIRITPNLTPADNTGRMRVSIHYLDLTAETS